MNTPNAIINFCYFTANFRSDFIDQCWKDEPTLTPHLKDKFSSCATGSYISSGDFMQFFFQLSKRHQTKLINWISENYTAFSYLKD